MTPMFYWLFLILLFVATYTALRLGVAIGRHQEFLRRSQPLLTSMLWIRDAATSTPRAAHETIAVFADKTLKLHAPK